MFGGQRRRPGRAGQPRLLCLGEALAGRASNACLLRDCSCHFSDQCEPPPGL